MKTYSKQLLFTSILLVSSTISRSQCSVDSVNIYSFTTNGIKYEIVKEKLNWVDAAACAVSRGGMLAEINSKAEEDTLFYHVNKAGINAANTVAPDGGGASYLWLGGNDLAVEGKWIWNGDNDSSSTQFWQGTTSGSAVGGLYNNWGNEPDNFYEQDCLGFAFTDWPLGVAGEWNDVAATNLLYYIIEYPNTTSIQEIKARSFSLYPNPVSDIITVNTNSSLKNSSYIITDQLGRTLFAGTLTPGSTQLDISQLIPGVYIFHVGGQYSKLIKE